MTLRSADGVGLFVSRGSVCDVAIHAVGRFIARDESLYRCHIGKNAQDRPLRQFCEAAFPHLTMSTEPGTLSCTPSPSPLIFQASE